MSMVAGEMTHHRIARLNEQFKREISHVLSLKVRDPRVGRVLVTGARVTPDLWLARVFFRPLDEGKDAGGGRWQGLEAAAPFIRKELGKVLRVRRIPELRFLHDTTLDSAQRIEEVLKEVLPPSEDGEGPDLSGEGGGVKSPRGILLVDKAGGPTSHDVVDRIRKAIGNPEGGPCRDPGSLRIGASPPASGFGHPAFGIFPEHGQRAMKHGPTGRRNRDAMIRKGRWLPRIPGGRGWPRMRSEEPWTAFGAGFFSSPRSIPPRRFRGSRPTGGSAEGRRWSWTRCPWNSMSWSSSGRNSRISI